jgi:hypothetical protein
MAQQMSKPRLNFIEVMIIVIGIPFAIIAVGMTYNNWIVHTTPTILGIPTITPEKINDVLCSAKSDACGTGQSLYDEGYKHNINAEFALAVFSEGSEFGKLPCSPTPACITFHKTWQNSYKAWYDMIAGPDFVGAGLTSPSAVIAKLNPPNVSLYTQALNSDVKKWDA